MNNEKRKNIWSVLYQGTEEQKKIIKEIAEKNGISEICAIALYNRGHSTAQKARDFLNFDDLVMHSPFLMKDMEKAIIRINQAVENHEKIIIYGDYDVDGVTSVTTFYLYLKNLGADVMYYIPNRVGEGYGLSRFAVEKMAEAGVELIITVDTGITAIEETELAKDLGIDIVITDHHECQESIPDAVAVVNPHRHDCEYPFDGLAGVGVVFKVITAYEIYYFGDMENEAESVRKIYYNYADLVAIGTVADVMPLVDENRIIVKFGLTMLENTERLGLLALMEAANGPSNPNVRPVIPPKDTYKAPQKKRKINSGYIGFALAPRLNAAGRISSASKAVELLLADNAESAVELAHELCEINYQRQLEENKIADAAYEKINKEFDFDRDKVIVVSDNEWLQGVVGIVSSKVTERYGLPSILVSFDGSMSSCESALDIGKGSGRSVKGFNLVDALSHSKEALIKFGGHELAAGLTVRRKDIDLFKKLINDYANEMLDGKDMVNQIDIDCELSVTDITMPLAKEMTSLEPFGTSNTVPLFMLNKVKVLRSFAIGGGRHAKFLFEKDGKTLSGVMFGHTPLSLGIGEGEYADILFNIDINDYQNIESVQLVVQDIKLSDDYVSYFENENALYNDILHGQVFSAEDDIVPSRDDLGVIYTLLRREFRVGNDMMHEKEILSKLQNNKIRLAKLKFALDILNELKICTVFEVDKHIYQYDIYFNPEKTNIEKSGILKKLKNQCKR